MAAYAGHETDGGYVRYFYDRAVMECYPPYAWSEHVGKIAENLQLYRVGHCGYFQVQVWDRDYWNNEAEIICELVADTKQHLEKMIYELRHGELELLELV